MYESRVIHDMPVSVLNLRWGCSVSAGRVTWPDRSGSADYSANHWAGSSHQGQIEPRWEVKCREPRGPLFRVWRAGQLWLAGWVHVGLRVLVVVVKEFVTAGRLEYKVVISETGQCILLLALAASGRGYKTLVKSQTRACWLGWYWAYDHNQSACLRLRLIKSITSAPGSCTDG